MKPLTILALLAFAGCSAHNNLAPMPNVTQPPIGNGHDGLPRYPRHNQVGPLQARRQARSHPGPLRLLGRLGRGPQRHEQRHVRPGRQQRYSAHLRPGAQRNSRRQARVRQDGQTLQRRRHAFDSRPDLGARSHRHKLLCQVTAAIRSSGATSRRSSPFRWGSLSALSASTRMGAHRYRRLQHADQLLRGHGARNASDYCTPHPCPTAPTSTTGRPYPL